MAVFDNFVFADPQLQQSISQEAIGMAQLAAAQERARSEAADRLSRERNTRAVQQAEIDRAERARLEQSRQFGLSQDLDRERIAAYERMSSAQKSTTGLTPLQTHTFNALSRQLADKADTNPMTLFQFKDAVSGLPPEYQKMLERDWNQQRERAQSLFDASGLAKARWDSGLKSFDPKTGLSKDGKTFDKFLEGFEKSQDKAYLQYDPLTRQFVRRFNEPRTDTFHVPIGRPPADTEAPYNPAAQTTPGVRRIEDLLRPQTAPALPGPVYGPEEGPVYGPHIPIGRPPSDTYGPDVSPLAPTQFPFEGFPLRYSDPRTVLPTDQFFVPPY